MDAKAVALGFLTDTTASIALSVLLVSAMSGAGIRQADILARMQSASGLLLNTIMGLGCTVLGGYVAGRVAKRKEIGHGAVVAVLSLLLGLILELFPQSNDPLRWYELLGYFFIIPSGAAGGYLALERNRRLSSETKG